MSGPVEGAAASVRDQLRAVELAELLEFVADLLAVAEGPRLRLDFADYTAGAYQLGELRGDLRRFAGWLNGAQGSP
jgi:hypothetical protein